MQMSDLRPARDFARQYGVKTVIYGKAGSGKTPIAANTTPRPLLLLSEPGALTLKGSITPTYAAFDVLHMEEFFTWFFNSHESKNFDTLIWDSVSQGAEIQVDFEMGGPTKAGNEQHGLRAYGKMARAIMKHLNGLYFMPQKHIVLIAKYSLVDLAGVQYARPYFPGKELPVRVPHLYDLVMQLGRYTNIPGAPVTQDGHVAFLTKETFGSMGRDRSGQLAPYEPPHMGQIFTKAMS